MHCSIKAVAVCACLLPLTRAWPAVAEEPARATTTIVRTPADPTLSDDAAKHIKRTACLKDARERRLIGEARAAFIRECVES